VRRVLVTGARGFVGAPCVRLLVQRGFEVHAVSREEPRSRGVAWHQADLLDERDVDRVAGSVGATDLLHLAWCTEHRRFWTSPDNVRWAAAGARLVRAFAAHGGRRIVVAGSCAEYHADGGLCVEDRTPIEPPTIYGASKHALHVAARGTARGAGVSLGWARLFHLFGPNEQPSRLVPAIIRALLSGEPARCSIGEQVRDFMYVDDAASAIVAFLESGVEGAVNIGSGSATTVADFAGVVAGRTGRAELLRIGARPSRSSEPSVLVPSLTRLTREVGWSPASRLDQALDATIAWWAARQWNPQAAR
jgi:nucleoside-diphosphate-sugar epimerase